MRICCGLTATVVAPVLFSSAALAHHPTPTTRVAEPLQPNTSLPNPQHNALFQTQLQWDYSQFGRTLRRSSKDPSSTLGRITRHLLHLGVGATSSSGLAIAASLFAGRVQLHQADRTGSPPRDPPFGFGDLQLQVSQSLHFDASVSGLRAGVGIGAALPTGHYEPQTRLESIEVSPDVDGQLDVVTRSSQASLGAGSFGLSGFTFASYQLLDSLTLSGTAALRVPLTRTIDRLRWGRDIQARGGAHWRFLPKVLTVSAGISYLHHSQDREQVDSQAVTFGGWQQLSLFSSLQAQHSSGLHCLLGAELPLWQYATSSQLMLSSSLRAGCGWSTPL